MKMKVHHLGYAVASIEKAQGAFEALGWSVSSSVTDDVSRNVRIMFLEKEGQVVELVAPLNENSPIKKTLAQNKGVATPYHICYEVASLTEAEVELKKNGFMPFIPPAPAPAIENRRVEFLFNLNLGIIELVEKSY